MEKSAEQEFIKGQQLIENSKYHDAIKCFTAAISYNVNFENAWLWKGWCEQELREYAQAVESYTQALKLDPNNETAWNNKGLALINLKRQDEGIECCNKALKLDPNDDVAWNNKGLALINLKRQDEAIECCNKALKLEPNNKAAWCNKGLALRYLKRYDEAIECYNKALKLDPNDQNTWNNKGAALRELKRYDEAIECLNKALQIEEAPIFWSNKGETLNRSGRYQEAADCQQTAISIEPESFMYYRLGKALTNLGKIREAIESYKNCLKIDSDENYLYGEPNPQRAQDLIRQLEGLIEEQKQQDPQLNEFNQEKTPINMNSKFLKAFQKKDILKVYFQFYSFKKASNQFFYKLNELEAFLWSSKFTLLQSQYQEEIGQYSQYIQSFLMTEEDFDKITIETANAIKTQFAILHFGLYNDQKVVIKKQKFAENTQNQDFIAVLREIAILAFCDHPNIIPIKGVCFYQEKLAISIIMPRYYYDLYSLLFGNNATVIPKKKVICCQIVNALIYIHNAGLIHLDLKLQNILFKSSKLNKIALLDFGISKIPKDNTKGTDILGVSYFYCPPEINQDSQSIVSEKADIFSLGIILYEFITVRRAWKNYLGKGGIAIYNLIHSKTYNFFKENTSTGNNDLDKLILDCVNCEQSLRPSAQEVLKRIQKISF